MSEEFYDIEVSIYSNDFKVLESIVKVGIDWRLNAFIKSKFQPVSDSRYKFSFHESEFFILQYRLKFIYGELWNLKESSNYSSRSNKFLNKLSDNECYELEQFIIDNIIIIQNWSKLLSSNLLQLLENESLQEQAIEYLEQGEK